MKITTALFLLAVSVLAHFVALYTGVYEAQMLQGRVWFDNVLHALVGAAFGLLWFGMLERRAPECKGWRRAATTVLFVAAMAAAWELFEVAFYLFFESHALGLKVYSPTLREALFDSASNLLGALLFLIGSSVGYRREVTAE